MSIEGEKGAKVEEIGSGYWAFHCPGCKSSHCFRASAASGPGPVWEFNGDVQKPSVKPSIVVDKDNPESRCHFHITDGQIRYQMDCWHELKGQVVDMVPYDDD